VTKAIYHVLLMEDKIHCVSTAFGCNSYIPMQYKLYKSSDSKSSSPVLHYFLFTDALPDCFPLVSSKVQARIAFSSYLQRVQQRLLAEMKDFLCFSAGSAQELVIRFLRRAASNLQQDIKVVLPSRQLPLQDRRRILSHQLGEFIHCYNKETEHMMKKQESSKEEHCVNPRVFQEYITAASENDLEEVLTFYTQKNKSATVFLGTKVQSIKKQVHEVNLSGDSDSCENRLGVLAPGGEGQRRAGRQGLRRPASGPRGAAWENPAGRPGGPALLRLPPDSRLHALSPAALPRCSPVAAPSLSPAAAAVSAPPAPPAPVLRAVLGQESLLPLRESVRPPGVLPRPRGHSVTPPLRGTGFVFESAAAFSVFLIGISFFLSANKKGSSSKLKSNSVGAFKELNTLSAQAQSNQQAFISALQKLADQQVARRYGSSGHINLLTHHVSSLQSIETPPPPGSPRTSPPVTLPGGEEEGNRTDHNRSARVFTTSLQAGGGAGVWDGQTQNAYTLVTGTQPRQRYQPTAGSYQLQLAIQQLQQQRLQSHQCVDQSHCKHQITLFGLLTPLSLYWKMSNEGILPMRAREQD
uniref:Uncharacterized protein n=1 Tax=Salarias fasciatus TaxID=181472 RepID=A0A672G0F8_SALFA